MAIIHKSRILPDYFSEVDFSLSNSFNDLLSLYEDEKIIILKNLKIQYDAEFFGSFRFPINSVYKKFKVRHYLEGLMRGADLYPNLESDCFGGDAKMLKYFRSQLEMIFKQVVTLLEEVAPSYKIRQHLATYRGGYTVNENLHLDFYKQELPFHHFRLFINLDSCHRIWHTSWRLSDLLNKHLAELPHELIKSSSAGELVKELNFHVFGGRDGIYEDLAQPRHTVFFEPGEIWFVDSRTISHQIFYGRQALSTESVVELQNMINVDNHYIKRINAKRLEIIC